MEKKINNEPLARLDKLEAVTALAGGLAHDFNNLLWAIAGYAEMALEDVSSGGEAEDNLKQILKAANRARSLVRDFLTFSRETEGQKGRLDLTPLVKESLKLLRAALPAGIELRQEVSDQECPVWVSPAGIHHLVISLCLKAVEALKKEGGILTVALAGCEIDPSAPDRVFGLDYGQYIRLSVAGASARGASSPPTESLEAVKEMVLDQGGEITQQPAPGQTWTWHVFLPRLAESRIETAEAGAAWPRGTERILYVDDEDLLVDMHARLLSHLGYRVSGFTDGRQALEVFRADPNRFDLVMTDQIMPRLSGLSLAAGIKAIKPDLPVILCTGFMDDLDQTEIRAAGIRALLTKPLLMGRVAQLIRDVLDGKI
ncbi:MAG: response regulator [Thermodesulfobacteriota bacterium]